MRYSSNNNNNNNINISNNNNNDNNNNIKINNNDNEDYDNNIVNLNEIINFLHLRRAFQHPIHFKLTQINLWCLKNLLISFTFPFRRERQKYYKHQNKAKKMPDRYMSVITDGMNSSKTNIPHFKVKSKVSLFQHRLWRYLKKAAGGKAVS